MSLSRLNHRLPRGQAGAVHLSEEIFVTEDVALPSSQGNPPLHSAGTGVESMAQ